LASEDVRADTAGMTWGTRLTDLTGTRYPIVQAPMAGGLTTPELVAAVSEAGALGSIGAAVLSPDELRSAIQAVRQLTGQPFAVNLFAPLPRPDFDRAAIEAMNGVLARMRDELGLPPPAALPAPPTYTFADQLAVVAEERVPIFSFTFGLPPLEQVKEAGCVVLGTATTAAEAEELVAHGVDVVVVQGFEAGGHRGTFRASFERSLVGGLALLPQVVDRVTVPVIYAGGVMDGRGIVAALALGADGVQLGTAFLGCPESGTPDAYRRALTEAKDDSSVLTAVYTGRPARVLHAPYVDVVESSGVEVLPYPLQALVAMDIRTAAVEQGRADLLFALAGQAAGMVRDLPAGDLVATLVREAEETTLRLSGTSPA
jgi:nitronate monooxygenase